MAANLITQEELDNFDGDIMGITLYEYVYRMLFDYAETYPKLVSVKLVG